MHMIMAANSLMPLPCTCANLRRASRAVTQLYDQALRGSGLRITQFTLLQFLALLQKPVTQGALGTQLALDSTTLSRTLQPLVRARWIETTTRSDGRERWIELTPLGRRVLRRATPAWARVQHRLRAGLGGREWGALQGMLTRVAGAAERA